MLSREEILFAEDLPCEEVLIAEWGGAVRVRTLSGAERDAFEAASVQTRGKNREVNLANLRARLAVLCVVDDAGKRLFEDHEAAELGKKSAKALARIYDAAARLNGLTAEDAEELAKNSESGPTAASTSNWPLDSARPCANSSPRSTPAS
jgi:hypothetical protein